MTVTLTLKAPCDIAADDILNVIYMLFYFSDAIRLNLADVLHEIFRLVFSGNKRETIFQNAVCFCRDKGQ